MISRDTSRFAKVYLPDLSLSSPNSPHQLLTQLPRYELHRANLTVVALPSYRIIVPGDGDRTVGLGLREGSKVIGELLLEEWRNGQVRKGKVRKGEGRSD